MMPSDYCTFKGRIGQELRIRKGASLRSGATLPGYLLVLVAAALTAIGGNAVKQLFRLGYPPLVLAQIRLFWAFASISVLVLLLRPRSLRVRRTDLWDLAVYGVLGLAGVQFLYYLSISRLNIAVALVLEYLGLVAVTAWERYRRHQAVPPPVWVALVLVLGGSFFTVGAYRPELLRVNLPGIVISLLTAVSFAYYLLRSSTLVRRFSTWTMLTYGFGAGMLGWAVYDLIAHPALPGDPKVWAVMALIGVAGTLVPFALYVLAMTYIRPSRAGITGTAEPVIAGLIAVLLLHDALEPLQIFGGLMVVAGIAVVLLTGESAPVSARVIDEPAAS
jgi:drug/metabolite transporter (DMT)-like permease